MGDVKAVLLTIGTEVLLGQILDTNAAYLGQELLKLGIPLAAHETLSDEL